MNKYMSKLKYLKKISLFLVNNMVRMIISNKLPKL